MEIGADRLKNLIWNRVAILIALLSLAVSLSVYHPYPYDNVVTRWALASRLVSSGTLSIDPYATLTSDKAYAEGHYYSDKSFLPSAAAAFAYLPFEVLGLSADAESYPIGGAARYIAERLTVSLALLGVLLLLRRQCLEEGLDPFLPVLALGLGSIMLPYSTLLYTHVPAAFLLFAAYQKQSRGSFVTSDLLGGLAVAWEYTLIIPFLVLLAYRGMRYWNAKRTTRAVLLLIMAMTPQFIHNWMAFGSPFKMGYALEVEESFASVSKGFFGFTYPTPARLYRILISPERGIFFYMPWAVFGLWGLSGGAEWRRTLRRDSLFGVVVSYMILYSAQNASTAGWAFGQRYLIAVVPFFALGLARAAKRSSSIASMATLAVLPGLIQALLGTFGELHLPVHPVENPIPLPQWNISLRMLLDGHHSFWVLGGAGVAVLSVLSLATWWLAMRRVRPKPIHLSWFLPWILLGLLSFSQDWGGKVDYYRGILAAHRREWNLAAEYYEAALHDPSAPGIIEQRLRAVQDRLGSAQGR